MRSSHALAAPYPFALYSDLYEHKDFIRGLVNGGFSGLLGCPEVRHAASAEDLIRRLQVVALSPLAQVDAWYICLTLSWDALWQGRALLRVWGRQLVLATTFAGGHTCRASCQLARVHTQRGQLWLKKWRHL